MKFLVVGHPCVDEIHAPRGPVIRSWGGVFYTIAAMQHCARIDDQILPIAPIGAAEEQEFRLRLSGYTHVDQSGLYAVPAQTNRMVLRYRDAGRRTEHCASMLPPVTFETVRPHIAGAHFLLLNCVSGREMTLDTLRQVRVASRRPHVFIYLDVHALTLGDPPADGPRSAREVPDWADWLMNVDGVQLNEHELAGFGGSEQALCDSAMMFRNVQVINVTRGDRGVSVYARDTKGEPVNAVFSRNDVPPVTLGPTVDGTGCGDVFGGAFLMYYAYSRHAILAAQFAAFVAAANSRLPGANAIDELREYVAHYPTFP